MADKKDKKNIEAPLVESEVIVEIPNVAEVTEVREMREVKGKAEAKEASGNKDKTKFGSEDASGKEIQEAPTRATASAQSATVQKDETIKKIEDILSEDLTDIFLALPEDKKPLFRKSGEEVAVKIKEMVIKGKVRASKVLKLIQEWLKIIPGVNRFFLEQEAKIRTDQILDMLDKESNVEK
ncbi:MAG: hypothetical protein Q8P30_00600 [Candidatus Uhrbacteria bacterium]|nr:hypothetical protein [Candidatus Uhrbacteria bacterium]